MTKGKIIMLRGLPRSGKSTWAKEFRKNSGNAYIVSRDSLREMLHDGVWSPKNEGITIDVQKAIVKEVLKHGKVVLIDDTNLSKMHHDRWRSIADECNSSFEVHHEKECDLKTLISRDNSSPTPRGSEVIVNMALQEGYVGFKERSVVICDLDGTLCDAEHRRHFVRGDNGKDWKSFFDNMQYDSLNLTVAEMLQAHHKEGHIIFFVSGRPDSHREITERWLYEYGFVDANNDKYSGEVKSKIHVPYFALLMRRSIDKRPDTEVKKDILDRYFKREWILQVIDDRPSVIRMWRENGLDVIDCGDGTEF